MTGVKSYTEETRDDALKVVRSRFSVDSFRIAAKYLQNPLCVLDPDAGDVAYQDDRPVGFQAAVLRRLHLGREEFIGVVGGMLGMEDGASPVLLMQLMKRSIAPRGGSTLFFANTANAASMKMNRLLGVKGKGPITCERIRFASAFWPKMLKVLVPRPRAKRLMSFEPKLFDDFWRRYLIANKGVVCSRTTEELRWVFGDRTESGEVVVLGSLNGDNLAGYIVLKRSKFVVRGLEFQRWMILDWIALDNDRMILAGLLRDALRFLRRETRAMLLESIGFPEFVEPILAKYLPFRRKTESNSFLYQFTDTNQVIPEGSWFFGPYDGDRGM